MIAASGLSGASFAAGIVSGAAIANGTFAATACFTALCSAVSLGLALPVPISTTMLRSSRNVCTSGSPLSEKITAAESNSLAASIDSSVGGIVALASARSHRIG